MMTGNGVMHNGTTILDQYGQNLDRLQVNSVCMCVYYGEFQLPMSNCFQAIHKIKMYHCFCGTEYISQHSGASNA